MRNDNRRGRLVLLLIGIILIILGLLALFGINIPGYFWLIILGVIIIIVIIFSSHKHINQ
jgi:uncharacterized membrane protein HdeD (DUF308 family)